MNCYPECGRTKFWRIPYNTSSDEIIKLDLDRIMEITSERSNNHSEVILSNTDERSNDHSSVLAETINFC